MSSTISSLFAFDFSSSVSTSKTSGETASAACFAGSLDAQGNTTSFEELILSLTSTSDTSASATSDNTATTKAPMSNGLDQIFNILEQMVADAENTLENINTGSTSAQSSNTGIGTANVAGLMDSSTSFAVDALANGGPLPAFLAQVDIQMGLDSTQRQALQNIANENMDATDTPATVQKIALELQQANI